MPTIPIILTPGSLGPSPCYTDEQSRYNAYTGSTQATLPINFTTVIISTTAPSPDDRDKVWIKTDGAGRNLGLYLFSNGQWQTVFPSTPYLVTGEFRWYDPNLYTPAQSANEPWFPCDSSVTGVPDLRGRFLVGTGLRILPSGSTDQATNFTYGMTGGRENLIPDATNMPAHGHTLIGANLDPAGGTNPSSDALPRAGYPGISGFISGGNTTGLDANGVPNPPNPMIILVPYYAAAIMQWRPDLT